MGQPHSPTACSPHPTPLPRTPPWRDLVPGIVAIALVLAGAFVIARYARVGAVHGDTFPLVVFAGDVGDLAKGSEVWLGGQKVGLVDGIGFRSTDSDTAYRLRMDLTVLERARPLLRTDSRARVATGGTLLGASVLALSVGTPAARPLQDGDTILAQPRIPPASLTERVSDLAGPATELRDNVLALTRGGSISQGTLGQLARGEAVEQLARLTAAIRAFPGGDELGEAGRGSVALAMHDVQLRERSSRLRASTDSLRALLSSGTGTLGRFRRDSTLPVRVAELRDEAARLRALVAGPGAAVEGTRSDSALSAGLTGLHAELDALFSDMKRRPLRYLWF